MLAATYTLKALDPLWFRGLGPAGNTWDPSVLHATALNHALIVALGFEQPHLVFDALWAPHSLPYPQVGLWMSPAELVPGTAQPAQVFRGGRSGEKLQITASSDKSDAAKDKEERGASTFMAHITAEGDFEVVAGLAPKIGKPYLTTGYFGEWHGLLFAEESAVSLFPGQGLTRESFLIRLGPNRVVVEMVLEPFVPVEVTPEVEDVFADHLSDPVLLPDDAEGIVLFAKPAPLVRALANGRAGDLRVRTFPFHREVSA